MPDKSQPERSLAKRLLSDNACRHGRIKHPFCRRSQGRQIAAVGRDFRLLDLLCRCRDDRLRPIVL